MQGGKGTGRNGWRLTLKDREKFANRNQHCKKWRPKEKGKGILSRVARGEKIRRYRKRGREGREKEGGNFLPRLNKGEKRDMQKERNVVCQGNIREPQRG